MKSVLLVSPYPYTPSSRGMDVMTRAFELSGWQTDHLMFPHVIYSIRQTNNFETGINQLKGKLILMPYIDSVMHGIPDWTFRLIRKYHCQSSSHIDWNRYDAVILESGKPLFLLDIIPENVRLIYRQSDSVRLILSENPSYIAMEDRMIDIADRILVVKERFRQFLPEKAHGKTQVIPNGIPPMPVNDMEYEYPYPPNTINAINIGIYPLDLNGLELICKKNTNVHFHIFGNCIRGQGHAKIKRLDNVTLYGFTAPNTFLPYLANADMYIYPFQRTKKKNYFGLTSKYYMPMKFGLPIISYPMEPLEDFKGLPVDFCATPDDFAVKVKEIARNRKKRYYKIDWDKISRQAILDEYMNFAQTLRDSR